MKDDVKGFDVYHDAPNGCARGEMKDGAMHDTAKKRKKALPSGVTYNDFYAYMPQHVYIFVPTRETWPASSVNSRLPPVIVGEKTISASKHLDKTRPVEQMTWAPGEPMLIEDRLLADGGWIERPGVNSFNLYRAPIIKPGDAKQASPWLDHIRHIYPDEANEIVRWLAHRVQRPNEKINHALVLGGAEGIGKDTLLAPVKVAVGPWNFAEASPQQVLGRFNAFIKSVILRINEGRDLGDVNRYAFYDHTKCIIAAPPDVLPVDEKHLRVYSVPNITGVILTTNYKTGGLYLPPDNRRHFVAWSTRVKEEFEGTPYFPDLWHWYRSDGIEHVAAYLQTLDISDFDPQAPPRKTPAWWDIVDSNRAPEDAELSDVLDRLGNPDAVTLLDIILEGSDSDFVEWMRDRKNRRLIPHRFEQAGYVAVRNDTAKDGLWKIKDKRQVVYAKATLSVAEQVKAAWKMIQ
jgi:hypothetical protein